MIDRRPFIGTITLCRRHSPPTRGRQGRFTESGTWVPRPPLANGSAARSLRLLFLCLASRYAGVLESRWQIEVRMSTHWSVSRRWQPARPDVRRLGTASISPIVTALALPLFAIFAANHRGIVDDAFITFRYAQHWVETGRLTWHIGLPMVDGYTSLAHVMLIALGIRLGFDPITFNSCLNLVCVLGILAIHFLLCRLFHVESWGRIIGLI